LPAASPVAAKYRPVISTSSFLFGTIYAIMAALLQGIASLFPGFDSSIESFDVPVALVQ
jgi:hypothetical protein